MPQQQISKPPQLAFFRRLTIPKLKPVTHRHDMLAIALDNSQHNPVNCPNKHFSYNKSAAVIVSVMDGGGVDNGRVKEKEKEKEKTTSAKLNKQPVGQQYAQWWWE